MCFLLCDAPAPKAGIACGVWARTEWSWREVGEKRSCCWTGRGGSRPKPKRASICADAPRTVRLQVAWSEVTLCPPCNGQERQQAPVSGWCVRCWEASKRKNALEWILFTTVAITDAASALECIEWYRLRWVVEEDHKALKTGCAMEQRQLRSAPGLLALLGLLAIVAVRAVQVRTVAPRASRNAPSPAGAAPVPGN